jgi:hypothetical protein
MQLIPFLSGLTQTTAVTVANCGPLVKAGF